MARHKEYYKGGRWWLPPSLGHDESYESVFAHGSSVHQKCSNYTLTNLLFGLCRSVWVIDLLVTLPNPISKFWHAPLPPKCCEPRNMPQLLILLLFSPFGFALESIKEFGGVSNTLIGVFCKNHGLNYFGLGHWMDIIHAQNYLMHLQYPS
jgi:hypothetical protein